MVKQEGDCIRIYAQGRNTHFPSDLISQSRSLGPQMESRFVRFVAALSPVGLWPAAHTRPRPLDIGLAASSANMFKSDIILLRRGSRIQKGGGSYIRRGEIHPDRTPPFGTPRAFPAASVSFGNTMSFHFQTHELVPKVIYNYP